MRRLRIAPLALAALAGCAANGAMHVGETTASPSVATIPPGPEAALVRAGHDLITRTQDRAKPYVGAHMECEACHLQAGTKPGANAFIGVAAAYPEWSARAKRFITLQDRIAECFLYSMNGRPPAYSSHEMVAITAYITSLSRGIAIGTSPSDRYTPAIKPDHAPNAHAGAAIYAQRCQSCHAPDGGGMLNEFPPLWGAHSFNGGAGMHRIATMAAFVHTNMPFGAPPNTLSAQEAYDVAAYVLSHPRPSVDPKRLVTFPPLPTSFF